MHGATERSPDLRQTCTLRHQGLEASDVRLGPAAGPELPSYPKTFSPCYHATPRRARYHMMSEMLGSGRPDP
eukprot:768461-Hanusia_phi.AAC.7